MKTVLYPGSFDPVTNGHLDIVKRASKMFDEVTVGVLVNSQKNPMFSAEERVALIVEAVKDLPNVKVIQFSGLLVNYVEKEGITAIVKGLRAISDFEMELQMASMNKKLNDRAETIFMMTATEYSYLSSSLVKEVFKFGGEIEGLVPPNVYQYMHEKNKV
jgi:pantetheine-phosphate adenylyltransferase